MDFVVCTGSKNKLREISAILGFSPPSASHDIDEIQGSPAQVIAAKARAAARLINKPVLVEDVSLDFLALNGMPGPYIKDFVESVGAAGLWTLLTGFDDKRAVARCSMALCWPEGELHVFVGECPGLIVEPRGEAGFGFDPCFQPEGFQQTYAELPAEVKNTVSHRARALALLQSFVQSRIHNNATAATTAPKEST